MEVPINFRHCEKLHATVANTVILLDFFVELNLPKVGYKAVVDQKFLVGHCG